MMGRKSWPVSKAKSVIITLRSFDHGRMFRTITPGIPVNFVLKWQTLPCAGKGTDHRYDMKKFQTNAIWAASGDTNLQVV
jgi:hypothetical protein